MLLRDKVDYLTDRYSERKEKAAKETISAEKFCGAGDAPPVVN
ncbi:hypothetical protein [Nostoc sp.]